MWILELSVMSKVSVSAHLVLVVVLEKKQTPGGASAALITLISSRGLSRRRALWAWAWNGLKRWLFLFGLFPSTCYSVFGLTLAV